MLNTANITDELAAAEIRMALQGKRCWYGYVGIGCTFAIDLGRKVARDPAVVALHKRLLKKFPKMTAHPEEHLRYEGESHLLVWCSWRMDDDRGPVASSDNESPRCEAAIERLIGKTVRRVDIGSAWDLRMEFSSGLVVSIFPDHVGPDASIDTNWELWRPEQAYFIGDDLACRVQDRENRPMLPGTRSGRWRVRKDVDTK